MQSFMPPIFIFEQNHPAAERIFVHQGPCTNIRSNPLFIREILDMTGISIEETVIHIPLFCNPGSKKRVPVSLNNFLRKYRAFPTHSHA